MNDHDTPATARFGSAEVPVLRRNWSQAPAQPYRRTYDLTPGHSWHDMATSEQREQYVLDQDGTAVPVGAMVARELKASGADEAAFVELWGGERNAVLVDQDLFCVARLLAGRLDCLASHVETGNVLTCVLEARGRVGGFPDVIAVFPDGRLALREVKRAGKDSVNGNQHEVADTLRELFGGRLELALVEWG